MNNKVKIILAISILLNAFLIGFVGSHAIPRHEDRMPPPFDRDDKGHGEHGEFGDDHADRGEHGERGGDHHGPPEEMFFSHIAKEAHHLSPGGEKAVTAILEKYRSSVLGKEPDKDSDAPDADFKKIYDIVTADHVDIAALKKAHEDLNLRETRMKTTIGNVVVDIASTLSKEDRVVLFKGLIPDHHHKAPEGGPKDVPEENEDD